MFGGDVKEAADKLSDFMAPLKAAKVAIKDIKEGKGFLDVLGDSSRGYIQACLLNVVDLLSDPKSISA